MSRRVTALPPSASLCNIGYELRRELTWDPEKESFIGDKQANELTDRKMEKMV